MAHRVSGPGNQPSFIATVAPLGAVSVVVVVSAVDGAWTDLLLFDPSTIARGEKRRVNDLPGGANAAISVRRDHPSARRQDLSVIATIPFKSSGSQQC